MEEESERGGLYWTWEFCKVILVFIAIPPFMILIGSALWYFLFVLILSSL